MEKNTLQLESIFNSGIKPTTIGNPYVVEVKHIPSDVGNLVVTINNDIAFGIEGLPDAKELQSSEFMSEVAKYVLENLKEEIKQACIQTVIDAHYFASQKVEYGHTIKKEYKKRNKENEERTKKKWKKIGFDPRGRVKNDGIVLTFEKVSQVISSLPAKDRTKNRVTNELNKLYRSHIDTKTFNRWLENNGLIWEELIKDKYNSLK